MKLTPSKNALLIAQQYLKHEFRKIFGDIKDPKIWKKLDKSIEGFVKRNGEISFWNLTAAISEGWKVKGVFHILSNKKYQWKLQEILLSKVVLGGMSPVIDKYTIKKFRREPLEFAEAWKKDKRMREEILRTGFGPHKERDHFPILVFQADDGFHVFDGMRRTLLTLINGQEKIKAWVGYRINSKGKPLISTNRCWFLSNIYELSKKQDKELEKCIIRIGREIIANYRNGREALIKRIAGWSHNPKIKEIFKKMLE